MSILRPSLAAGIALSILTILPAQSLDHSITLDDGDAASPDLGFGIAMSPDGTHAYAAIAGDIFGPNNDNLARLDVLAGTQLATGQTGLYPEDPALTLDPSGNVQHVYVANSTSGTLTCLTPALAPVATITLPFCQPFGTFPFGLLVSPDQTRIYVTTLGGCGDVHVVDCDPASATFNTHLTSFFVPNSQGRPSWWGYPLMVVPTATLESVVPPAFPSYSRAGFAVVNVASRALQASYLVTPVIPNHFTFTTECVVVPGNKVLLSVGNDVFPTVYECSLSTGAVTRTLNLNTITGVQLHGLATSPDQTTGVVTSLNGGESVFFDLASFLVTGVWDHGSTSKPNDVVFTPDGSRAVVSLQGAARVDVLKNVPGFDLALDAPSSVNVGSNVTYTIDDCEAGQGYAIFASLAGAGPQQVGPFTVYLTNPVFALHQGVGDLQGGDSVTFLVPNVPGLPGLTVSTQAATVDRDGGVRVSNGIQTLLN